MRPATLVLVAIAVTAALGSSARAFEDLTPTEALGMGGASRAWAVADEAPLLNPSGMSLTKAYTCIDGTYGYASRLSDQFLHASIVDSTSPFNLSGGLYYSYHTASPGGALAGHGHEGGAALAFPFGPYVSLGGTLKYFKLVDGDVVNGHDGGLTFDLGATIRPTPIVSVGIVGTNLRSLSTSQATQAVGYGVSASIPAGNAILVADGLSRFTPDNQTGRKGTSVMAGAGYTFDIPASSPRGRGRLRRVDRQRLRQLRAVGHLRDRRLRRRPAPGPHPQPPRLGDGGARDGGAGLAAPLHPGLPDRGPIAGHAGHPRSRDQSVTGGNFSSRPLSVMTWKRRSVSRGRDREPGFPTR